MHRFDLTFPLPSPSVMSSSRTEGGSASDQAGGVPARARARAGGAEGELSRKKSQRASAQAGFGPSLRGNPRLLARPRRCTPALACSPLAAGAPPSRRRAPSTPGKKELSTRRDRGFNPGVRAMSTRKLPRAPFTPPVELPGGRYFRLFELGRGGMASVELVVRSGPRGAHECFALKRPRRDVAQEPEVRAMFEEEVRNFRLLRHPNLVELVERLDDEGSPALVMEYIDGVTYDRLLDHDGFATHVFVLIEVLKGLEFLHGVRDTQGARLGRVHRAANRQGQGHARDGNAGGKAHPGRIRGARQEPINVAASA